MLTDTHFHPQLIKDFAYSSLSRVSKAIAVCLQPSEAASLADLCKTNSKLFYSVGLHPLYSGKVDDIIKFLTKPKCVAIGECGLDFINSSSNKEEQIKNFAEQLSLSIEYNKPVIVHSRNAETETLNMLDQYRCRGVLHSFTGSYEMAEKLIAMGYFISFSGIVTFKNASLVAKIAQTIPLDRLLIETDSPFLAPTPLRGKQNESNNVYLIAQHIARLRRLSTAQIIAITDFNAANLFHI